MTDKMKWLPKWIVSDEQLDKDWKQEEKFAKMFKTEREELESTLLLLEKYKYWPQLKEIKWSMDEAFGEYSKYIIVTNRMLVRIWDLVDCNYNLLECKWQDENNKRELQRLFDYSKIIISDYITEYWAEMLDKLEWNNTGKDFNWIIELVKDMQNKFIWLLLQRVQYVPK